MGCEGQVHIYLLPSTFEGLYYCGHIVDTQHTRNTQEVENWEVAYQDGRRTNKYCLHTVIEKQCCFHRS